MRQQVIYSMLAMAAVPAITMAQVANNEAIVPFIQKSTAYINGSVLNGDTKLAPGTYKLKFQKTHEDFVFNDTIQVGAEDTTAIVVLPAEGDIKISGLGGYTLQLTDSVKVEFPQVCVDYATNFTARYNQYLLGDPNTVRSKYSIEAADFLIGGGFNTYDNYKKYHMWNGVDELKAVGDELQKEIAWYALTNDTDSVLPRYTEAMEKLDSAIAKVEERINNLEPSVANKQELVNQLGELQEKRDSIKKMINKDIYSKDSVEVKDPIFNGSDSAYHQLKDGSTVADINALTNEVLNNLNKTVQDAIDTYDQFLEVTTWRDEAKVKLDALKETYEYLKTNKLIDITPKANDPDQFAFPGTEEVDTLVQKAERQFNTFFTTTRNAKFPSLGYRYYQTSKAEWELWYANGEARTRTAPNAAATDFRPYVMDAIKTASDSLEKRALEYKNRIDTLSKLLNQAVGTPLPANSKENGDSTAHGGVYKMYSDSLMTDNVRIPALWFKAIRPYLNAQDSVNHELDQDYAIDSVDVYADWRKLAADSLNALRQKDSLVYDSLKKSIAAGTVMTAMTGAETQINDSADYKNVLFDGEGSTTYNELKGYAVKADAINKTYTEIVSSVDSYFANIDSLWDSVDERVKKEWSDSVRGEGKGLESLYDSLKNYPDGEYTSRIIKLCRDAYDLLIQHELLGTPEGNLLMGEYDELNVVLNTAKDRFKSTIDKATKYSRIYHWITDSTDANKAYIDSVAYKFNPQTLSDTIWKHVEVWMDRHVKAMADTLAKGDMDAVSFGEGFKSLDAINLFNKHWADELETINTLVKQNGDTLPKRAYFKQIEGDTQNVNDFFFTYETFLDGQVLYSGPETTGLYDIVLLYYSSVIQKFIEEQDVTAVQNFIGTSEPHNPLQEIDARRTLLNCDEAKELRQEAIDSINAIVKEYNRVDAYIKDSVKYSEDHAVFYKGMTYQQALDKAKARINALIDSVLVTDTTTYADSVAYTAALRKLVDGTNQADGGFYKESRDEKVLGSIRWFLNDMITEVDASKEAFDLSAIRTFYTGKRNDLLGLTNTYKDKVNKFRADYLTTAEQRNALGEDINKALVDTLKTLADDLWLEAGGEQGVDTGALAKIDAMLAQENGFFGTHFANGAVASDWASGSDREFFGTAYKEANNASFKLGFDAAAGNQLRVKVVASTRTSETRKIYVKAMKGGMDASTQAVDSVKTTTYNDHLEFVEKVMYITLNQDMTADDLIQLSQSGVVLIKSVQVDLVKAADEVATVKVGATTRSANQSITFKGALLGESGVGVGDAVQINLRGKVASGTKAKYTLSYNDGGDVKKTFEIPASENEDPLNENIFIKLKQNNLTDIEFTLTADTAYRALTLDEVVFKHVNITTGDTVKTDTVLQTNMFKQYVYQAPSHTDVSVKIDDHQGNSLGRSYNASIVAAIPRDSFVVFKAPFSKAASDRVKLTVYVSPTGEGDCFSIMSFSDFSLRTVANFEQLSQLAGGQTVLATIADLITVERDGLDVVITDEGNHYGNKTYTVWLNNDAEFNEGDSLYFYFGDVQEYTVYAPTHGVHGMGLQIDDVVLEKASLSENYGDVVNTIQSEGYTTIEQYQEGIRNLQDIEKKLRDINDENFDRDNLNIADREPNDIVTLEPLANTYKEYVSYLRDNYKQLTDSIDKMLGAIQEAVAAGASYPLDVRNKFYKKGNQDNATGLLADVERDLHQLWREATEAYGRLDLYTDSIDSIRYKKWGKDEGRWGNRAGGNVNDSLFLQLDTLGNPARLAGATTEQLQLIGQATQITIDAFKQEADNQKAITVLRTLVNNAGDYIKARKEGYNVDTDGYLLVAPFVTDKDIPSIEILATSTDTLNVVDNDTLSAEAKDAAVTFYTDKLDTLKALVDSYDAELKTYTSEGQNGHNTVPTQQGKASTEGTTLYDKLMAIKQAADQVALDAKNNLQGYLELYKQLADSTTTSIAGIEGKFRADVEAADTISTKDKWQKVVESFQQGKDLLNGESIELSDSVATAYSYEFYPNVADRIDSAKVDGIDEWLEQLQEYFKTGTTAKNDNPVATYKGRAQGQFNTYKEQLDSLWSNINRGYQVFKGNYDPQIMADNENAWQDVKSVDKAVREKYIKFKNLCDQFKEAAAKNAETNEIVAPKAAKLDEKLYDASTLILSAFDKADSTKKAADQKPELFDKNPHNIDYAAVDSMLNADFKEFIAAIRTNLGNLGDTAVNRYKIETPWKVELENLYNVAPDPNFMAPYIAADSTLCTADSVFADVLADTAAVSAISRMNAADTLKPAKVAEMAVALNNLSNGKFEQRMDEELLQAAKNDVKRRVEDAEKQRDADWVAFQKDYNQQTEGHKNQVFDTDWAALKDKFDSIAAYVDSAKTAANTIITLDREAPNPLLNDRDSVLVYLMNYKQGLSALKTEADSAAAEYEKAWNNDDYFNGKKDSILDKLREAIEIVKPTYVDEDYNPVFAADSLTLTEGDAFKGIDPKSDAARNKIDSLNGKVDEHIVNAYNSEKGKLSEQYAAMFDDYTKIASRLNDSVNAARRAEFDAQTKLALNTDESKKAELQAALDAARDKTAQADAKYNEFVENYNNDKTSYFELVDSAKALTTGSIEAPVDSADMAELKKLADAEKFIAKLRNDLAAQVAGKTIEEFNAPIIAALNAKADSVKALIDDVDLGDAAKYLGYDYKKFSEKLKGIKDEQNYLKGQVQMHDEQNDVLMYNEQLLRRFEGVADKVEALNDSLEPAKANKVLYDHYMANRKALQDKMSAALDEAIQFAKDAYEEAKEFSTFRGTNRDSLLVDVDYYFDAAYDPADASTWFDPSEGLIFDKGAEAKEAMLKHFEKLFSQYDSLSEVKPFSEYQDGIKYEDAELEAREQSINENLEAEKANINHRKERAAYKAAYEYEELAEMAFPKDNDYKSLTDEWQELVDYMASVNPKDSANKDKPIVYPAATVDRIQKLLGKSGDATAEKSIKGAIEELEKSISDAKDDSLSYAKLQQHKNMTHAIVDRLKAITDSLGQKLLGDLDGVENSDYGDGGNGRVNSTDVAILVDIVLGKAAMPDPNSDLFAAADIDDDGEITVNDLTCLNNLILTGARYYNYQKQEIIAYAREMSSRNERLSAVLVSSENGQRTYAINLHSDKQYSSFQMDINLPEGMTLVGESLTERANRHKLYSNDLQQTHRVVVTNMSNRELLGSDGAVLTFTVQGEGELSFDNIIFSQADGHSRSFAIDATTTGIADKLQNMAIDAKETIYNVGGRVMGTLKKGVNIIRRDNGETEKVVK